MLNRIWAAFFFIGFVAALYRAVILGESGVWAEIVTSLFDLSKTAFEIALGLTGVMCLWLGVMRLGEVGGAVDLLARAFAPLLRRLFPGIPEGHPAMGAVVMNLSANMLGLDNAATPLGLKAMKELQELNPEKETASNDQILFLVVNTSAVTLIPATIFVYRAQMGAADPTDVFIPILVATFCSTMVGLIVTGLVQKLKLLDPVVLAYLGALTALVVGMVVYFSRLEREVMEQQSQIVSNFLILLIVVAFVAMASWKKEPVYERFVEGAKDGFQVAVGIIPFLVAMLIAIGVLRSSGALDLFLGLVRGGVSAVGLDTRFVDGIAHRGHAPLIWQWCAGLDARDDGNHGRRLVRWSAGFGASGLDRDHVLCFGRLLWFGWDSQDPPRGGLWFGCGPRRCDRRYSGLLPVLRLSVRDGAFASPKAPAPPGGRGGWCSQGRSFDPL